MPTGGNVKKYLSLLGILAILAFVALHVISPAKASTAPSAQRVHVASVQHTLKRHDSAECVAQLPYPDPTCTPGAVFSDVTADEVCTSGYSSTVRNVPTSEKDEVYVEYGVVTHTTGEYEVDHFIPLELGGSNDISNLWPEPASPTPGFHEKDKVENYLHKQVCSGAMSLSDAQNAIASDWLAVYNSMVRSNVVTGYSTTDDDD
jgi:hypothetical protein